MNEPGAADAHADAESLVPILDQGASAAPGDAKVCSDVSDGHEVEEGIGSPLLKCVLRDLAEVVFDAGTADAALAVGEH